MLRFFMFCTLALLTICPAPVQSADLFNIEATGFRGGVTLGEFRGDDSPTARHFGFTGGAFAALKLRDNLQLQIELMIIQKGTHREFTREVLLGTVSFEEDIKLTYLEVPMLIKFPIQSEGKHRSFLFLGPSFGLALGKTMSGIYSTTGASYIEPGDYSASINNTNQMDIGFVAGTGISFALGSRTGLLDLRYTLGLSTPFRDPTPEEMADDTQFPFVQSGAREPIDVGTGTFSITFGIQVGS